MAIELATAYISLVPSARGMKGGIERELGQAGKEGGSAASAAFGDEMEAGADGSVSSFGTAFKAGMVGLGLAAGAVLAKGLSDAIGNEAASDKLAAQLGLTPAESERLGGIAGDLYGQAYGDSLATVNEALRGSLQSGLLDEDATNAEIESVTAKALDLASAFDQDVGAASAAAGQLIRTGLAKDADEAFDIITAGFQGGVDKSGDFLDTINEYGTQFRKVGIDGATMTGILTQGLQAGARDADVVADSIKEFSIRAVDGSELTADSFERLGLSGEDMAAKIAAGGPEAAAALDQTLDKLREVEDPAERAQIAVGLFGTQAEDLGDALFALDPSEAAAGLGDLAGAAERMGTTLNDNAGTKIESFKRTALQGLTNFIGGSVIPGVEALATAFGEGGISGVFDLLSDKWTQAWPTIKETLGNFASNVWAWIQEQVPIIAEQLVEWVGAFIGWIIPMIPQALEKLGELVSALGTWVLEDGLPMLVEKLKEWGVALISWIGPQIPPLLLELGKLLLRFGEWFVTDALPMILRKVGEWGVAFIEWIKNDAIPGLVRELPKIISKITDWFTNTATPAAREKAGELADGIIEWFKGIPQRAFDALKGLPAKVSQAASGLFDGFKDAFKAAFNWIIDKWNGLKFELPAVEAFGQKIGGQTITVPQIPRFHDGGVVPGRPGQEVLALLEAGETVLTANQTAAGGNTFQINADGLSKDEAVQFIPRAIMHNQMLAVPH